RLLERNDVAVGELARLLAVNDLFARSGVDDGAAERSGPAAAQTIRRELLSIGQIRPLALVAQQTQIAAHTASASDFRGAGGLADQLEALDDDRLVGFL